MAKKRDLSAYNTFVPSHIRGKRESVKSELLLKESLLWLSGLRTQHGIHEDAGSIPGLAQCVKDLALMQGAAQISDVAQILQCCCCVCGIGQQLQLRLDPLAWEPPYAAGAALKSKIR